MCQYQTLYHHPQQGYVIRCMQCDQIQLGFGFLLLNLTEGGFRSLHSYLSHCCAEPCDNKHVRNRVLPTPYDGIQLMMSTEELEQFYHLLDSAESEMRAQAIIGLFKQ